MNEIHRGVVSILVSFLCAGCALPARAQTYTYSLLHTFVGRGDGATPYAGLIQDSAGNLYGTTYYGGKYGLGSVYKMDSSGNVTILHSCVGGSTDGKYVWGGVVRDAAGNLFGTTASGGTNGFGTVFELTASGKWKLLYSFLGFPSDGENPEAGLVRDPAGNFYGTTAGGGAGFQGTVFKLDKNLAETVLWSFTGGSDGTYPVAGLVRDPAGNLYGTTEEGGSDGGSVFELGTNGVLTALGIGGSVAGLVRDPAGNIYGSNFAGTYRDGSIFEIDSSGTVTTLYSFNSASEGGYLPLAALVRDGQGNLYGTTAYGGTAGAGTVFKLEPNGTETELYSFAGYPTDGAYPEAVLTLDAEGNLYGTTASGGSADDGTVFKLTRTVTGS